MPVAILKTAAVGLEVSARIKQMALLQNAVDEAAFFDHDVLFYQVLILMLRDWHLLLR